MKYFYSILCFVLTVPLWSFAQVTEPANYEGDITNVGERSQSFSGGTAQLKNPLDGRISTIPDFFKAIIDVLLVFAIPFVVFFIIWAGFLYVTARGNAEKIRQAHNALLYALIGGLLILGANLLLDIITNTVDQVADRP